MHFTALTAGQLLAALLGTTAVTVGLYLLRPRQRQVVVPFSALWQAALADTRATRLHRRLRHLWSLLLSLLVACCLVVAFADPRSSDPSTVGHTVVLVDCSPSMATADGQPDRLAAARDRVRDVLSTLPPGDRALLAALADAPTPLTPMTDDLGVLRAAVAELRPSPREASLEAGLAFARDMLAGRHAPRIVVISDGTVADPTHLADTLGSAGPALEVLPVGGPAENLSVTALAARRHPLLRDQSELLVEVLNSGDRVARAELVLSSDGRALHTEPLELQPGERARRSFAELSGIDERVEAHVRTKPGHDLLALDDRAYATVPPRRRVRVLAVTDGNLYLQAALLLDRYVDVTLVSPQAYAGPAGHDVLIFDDHVPPAPPGVPALYLHPQVSASGPEAAPLQVAGTISRPFFDRLDGDAAILRHVALRDVNVAEALKVRPQTDDQVIAASNEGPLIVAGTRAGAPFVALTFDPKHSDLPLRAAWPLLLLNILDSFQPDDVGFRASYRVGQRAEFVVDDPQRAQVFDPDGKPVHLERSEGSLAFTPRRAGFHALRDGESRRSLAVNLPEDLNPRLTPPQGFASSPSNGTAQGRTWTVRPAHSLPPDGRNAPWRRLPPWTLLVAVCLCALGIEWWTYHRRWTA